MFLIKSEDLFLKEQIKNLLIQKNFPINSSDNLTSEIIFISQKKENMIIKFNEEVSSIDLPADINNVFKEIIAQTINLSFKLNHLNYYPLKQSLVINNNELKLGYTHNQIFIEFSNNITQPINKEHLYKKLWPQDKTISLNKIDTHLTNLKNLIKKILNHEINFKTIDGNIFLIV